MTSATRPENSLVGSKLLIGDSGFIDRNGLCFSRMLTCLRCVNTQKTKLPIVRMVQRCLYDK